MLAPLLLYWLPHDREATRLLCMALGATTSGVVVALYGPREPMAQLVRFYERVRPPGFWGPVSSLRGQGAREARARLRSGLLATGLAAWSVFALLTVLGSLLIGSPAPSWVPDRALWLTLLIVSAIAAVPVWMRAGEGARAVLASR